MPGIWSEGVLGYYDGVGYTVRDAIHYWYQNVSETGEGVVFRDECTGPHCGNSCPENVEILLGNEEAQSWPVGGSITMYLIVMLVSAFCAIMKVRLGMQQLFICNLFICISPHSSIVFCGSNTFSGDRGYL